MSSSNDTNRIEAGDLLIEKNASGEIEIHNLADGESVTIGAGGLSASAIDTDKAAIRDTQAVSDLDSPLNIHAGLNDTSNGGRGIFLQGYDDGTLGDYTDKAPIMWQTRGLSTDVLIAQMMGHQTDNHWSLYTREEAITSGNHANRKRLDVEAGTAKVPVNWQNISEHWVGRYDDSQTDQFINSELNGVTQHLRTTSGQNADLEWLEYDTSNSYTLRRNGENKLALLYNASPYLIFDGIGEYYDFRQTETRKVVWQSAGTAGRPSNPAVGERFFDTDLAGGSGKPIWYNGTDWVDAQGSVV